MALVQHGATKFTGDDTPRVNLAETASALPVTPGLAQSVQSAPVLSTQQPKTVSTKSVAFDAIQSVRATPAPSAPPDSTQSVRTAPVPSVLLETRYYRESLSYLIPLRELSSWLALKNILASIREVNQPPAIYYCGTVVIGKYWPDIVHDGAKFIVEYIPEYNFPSKTGVPFSKYWAT
ncbi:MAG: hypothetical protein M1840_008786 [Geoglossum simile]|nr:MAG: hypothetical protein M1840_008786 [Geoglossum simile]